MMDSSAQPTVGAAKRRRKRRLRMHWRHEQLSLRMALAAATHHSAQPRAREGVEGETNDAPRRLKPPLPEKRPAPLEEVAEPQAKLGQHSGIGYELVLALDVPVLQMVEQPVDASALAFLEEEEAKALNVEYLTLARTATSHKVRLREVIQRMHVLRQKGRGRKKKKKKKRRKKRLPRSPRPRPASGCCLRSTRSRLLRTAWFYCGYMFLRRSWRLRGTISTLFLREGGRWLLRSILTVTCPHGFLQAQDVLHLGGMDQKDFMPRLHGRARRRLRHSHVRSLCPCCATTVLWSDSAEFRAGSAVLVHRRSSSFLSFRRGRSPWSRLFSRPQRFLSCRSFLGGRCPCCADLAVHRLFISVHSALLGSTAVTCGASVYGVFHFLRVLGVVMDPQVDSRPALYQRLLGSTLNTSLCVSPRGWSSWSQCTSCCIPSLSQAQDARLHGRHGPQNILEVNRCSSWTRFSTCPLVCSEWCPGPDSAVHCLAVPQLQFITVISSPSWRRGLPHGSECSADH